MENFKMKMQYFTSYEKAFQTTTKKIPIKSPLPFNVPYKHTFSLTDEKVIHYMKIERRSDCIYNMKFVPMSGLYIDKVDIIDSSENIISTLKPDNSGMFSYDEEPLMLLLIPYMDLEELNGVTQIQYKIYYHGKGTIIYTCNNGYLTVNTRKRYVTRSKVGRVITGGILYMCGVCEKYKPPEGQKI